MKLNTFYKLDYVPNKLAYLHSIEKGMYHFLYFCRENNEPLKAIKGVVKGKKDFKKIESCFTPEKEIKKLIEEVNF
jgi:hypothetical protein